MEPSSQQSGVRGVRDDWAWRAEASESPDLAVSCAPVCAGAGAGASARPDAGGESMCES